MQNQRYCQVSFLMVDRRWRGGKQGIRDLTAEMVMAELLELSRIPLAGI
jgi:hypothetical protein